MKKFKKLTLFLALLMFVTIILSSNVFAASEDVFDKILTDGKFVVHSVKPTSKEMAYTVVYEYTMYDKYPDYYIDWNTSFNEDFTKCTIYYGNYQVGDPSKEVEISYVYDEDVKTVVDSLISNSNDKTLEFDISEFSGTYIDVFGSSETLILNKKGKVTISGRVVTNNLSSIKKQSDGSYTCSISGGKITIYPTGVKSPQGNSSKIRIDVEEYGGAYCFQEK